MTSSNVAVLARLAREDVNIFNVHIEGDHMVVEYEYGWNPNDYKTKWTKAVYMLDKSASLEDALTRVLAEVKMIKEELDQ